MGVRLLSFGGIEVMANILDEKKKYFNPFTSLVGEIKALTAIRLGIPCGVKNVLKHLPTFSPFT